MADLFRPELKVSTLYLQDPNAWWRTWTWEYNLNLIGKDKMTIGKQVYDLPPRREDPYPRDLRTWDWSFPLQLIGKDRMITGKQRHERPEPGPIQPDRTWTQNLLQSTLAPIQAPVGEQLFARPGLSDDLALRGWIFSLFPLFTPPAPVGVEVYDLAPRPEDPFPRQLRAWAWSYNLNLIGQDRLPTGEQNWALPNRGPVQPIDVATWEWSYNLNLIGKDAMTTGEQRYDLPPPEFRERRDWAWWYNLNLIGQDRLPTGEQRYDVPVGAVWYQTWVLNLLESTLSVVGLPVGLQIFDRPQLAVPQPYSWAWTYNLNLIGQDRLPVGEPVFALPVPPPAPIFQSWTWRYNLNLIGKDVLPSGVQRYDLTVPDGRQRRDWAWSYNLNLIGQDKLPAGERATDLPAQVSWSLGWAQSLLSTTLSIVAPVGRQAYDLTPFDVRGFRSWSWGYILELIGQDVVPGKRSTDLPAQISWLLGWTSNLLEYTLAVQALPAGKVSFELPPRDPREARSWNINLVLTTLLGQDRMVSGEQVYATPPIGPPPLVPSWAWSYNLNLIGQDFFPPGEIATKLPIGPDWLLGWIQNLQQTTLAPTFARPFNQYDWPVPVAPQQPTKSWTWQYNPNLIGQDAMVTGKQIYSLWTPEPQRPINLNNWVWQYNLNLVGKDQLPVGAKSYDQAPLRVFWQRSWEQNLVLSTLLGQDRLPSGKRADALPPQPPVPSALVWTWAYNVNLIGQDALPVGDQRSELTPTAPYRLDQTWVQSLVAALSAATAVPFFPNAWQLPDQGFYQTDLRNWISQTKLLLAVPFRQTDWPVPQAPQQPALGWTWSYNLNLIGQDKLPTGEQLYARPVLDTIQPDRSFTSSGLSLIVAPIVYTVGVQLYNLWPAGPQFPVDLWNSPNGLNINLYPPPPPAPVVITFVTGDPYDRRKRYRFSQPFAPMDRWQYEEMLEFIEKAHMNASERRAFETHRLELMMLTDERDIEFLMLQDYVL